MRSPVHWRHALATLVALATLLSACGDDNTATVGASMPTAAPPTASGVDSQPPPAYVETRSGSLWMGYGSYCWEGVCADMAAPDMRDDIPTAVVAEGDEITFHLGFEPSELQLSFADGAGAITLPAERSPSWQVTRSGVLHLFARPQGAPGDAAYVLRLDFEQPSATSTREQAL